MSDTPKPASGQQWCPICGRHVPLTMHVHAVTPELERQSREALLAADANDRLDEIDAVLAEHGSPHLLESWRMTKHLHGNPAYLRSLADATELREPVGPGVPIGDLFERFRNPTTADRLAGAARLRAEAVRLTAQAEKIEREAGEADV